MAEMKWYKMDGADKDIAVSTRVRLARNFVDYPFEPRLNEAGAREIVRRVTEIFRGRGGWETVDFADLTPTRRMALAEEHLVSREFAQKTTPGALILNEAEGISIMVLEEDHLRIQCILPGLDIDEAYRRAKAADELIDEAMNYAYSDKLGYLTHCPTNLGTGMRASVMLFLPCLTKSGGMRTLPDQVGKLGLVIRGMSGERSAAEGCLYQLSNQVTLGISEEEIGEKLAHIVGKVAEQERALRARMTEEMREDLANISLRAVGMMMYSLRLTSAEIMSLYSDMRLGAALGLAKNLTPTAVDELLFGTMPNTMSAEGRSARERDRKRADAAREVLSIE